MPVESPRERKAGEEGSEESPGQEEASSWGTLSLFSLQSYQIKCRTHIRLARGRGGEFCPPPQSDAHTHTDVILQPRINDLSSKAQRK